MLTLPNYRITEQIYESANSLVYRGNKDNQQVILKMLKQDYPSPAELARYQQEYKITYNLNLAGVIKTYAIEKFQNTLVIILEDFGGTSLKELIAFKPSRSSRPRFAVLQDFLPIAIQITDILGNIHAANIIHKDINPSNIILEPITKQIKIIDFGIASLLPRENPTLKNPEQLEGTLPYLSPEQTGRINRSMDYRTDLYSLGVTFYELLTGKLPFDATDAMELVHCHIAKTPVPINEINPEIPQIISDIVMKLMAKNAEDRYQSAFGLKVDLEKCLALTKKVFGNKLFSTPFKLAQHDFSGKFEIPQKLYGRETEINFLLQAFERTSNGNTEMMLVAGYSGVGKTALVHEVHKPMTEKLGYFAAGKFDQFQKNIPYFAITQAFNQFCRYLLMENAETLANWKTKILTAVGNNGQIIIDVVPDLELIIGKQPLVAEVGATEAQNRFQIFFLNFIKVLCNKKHPFILFIDDLQWVDSASLGLLKVIMLDNEIQHLLIIGAYRDNEVDANHPFIMAVCELQKTERIINKIELANLQLSDVNELLQDTLQSKTSQTLADLIYQKTQGNAFFTHQFLHTLYKEELLHFNQQQWQWDVAQIASQNITDNVVELMANKLNKLPNKTLMALQLAACIGNQFDLSMLAIISELEQNESSERLQPAIIEGLIQPLDKNSQFKFLHDRVQQAAYAMIEDKQKQSTHLQIGRLLLKNTSADILEEKLFDIVSQFNKGLTLIVDAEEKLKIAKLNFTVSEKAKESNAYIPAYDYLQNSIYLLNEGTWDNHYDLMLAIYSALSQLTFLMADFSKMDEYIKVVLDNTTNTPDKLYAYEVKMQYLIALGKQSEALQLGFEILSLLDKNLSTELLENINFESIINLPEMTDTASLSAMQILNIMIAPAWASNSTIFEQICLTIINLSYKHGNCSLSSVGYVTYGGILCGKGEIETGYRFGKLGVELADKINVKQVRVRVHILFYSTVMHWKKPVRETVIPFYNAFQLGVDVGDIEYACYALVEPDIYQFLMGANLNTLDKKFSKSLVVVKQLKQDFHYNFLIPCYQAVHNLLGKTEGKVSNLSGVIFDKEELAPKFIKEQQFSLCCAVYQAQTILAFIFRECEDAYQNALLTEKYKESSGGMLFSPVHNFYYSLTLLAKIFTSSEKSQKELLELVNKNQVQLKHWANYAPTNFQHKYDLVEAEKARVLGNYWQAVNLYEEAIAGAKKNQYTHEEALAYELAAEFYSSCNMDKFTQIYLKEAYHCYQRWGAIAKVQQLEAKYPQLITTTLSNNIDINNTVISSNVTQLQMSTTLDLDSITKASQTLAGEIVLSKLLEKMMSIMIENAGAERGLLILEKGKSEWVIEAEGRLNIDEIAVLKSISLEGKLPISVVNYVVKTRESVVLDNSLQEGIYTKDDYIQQQQSKSVLCSPILHQGKLIGLLYLENSLMEGAFTSARLRLVDMLSSQVAISLDNALLYHTLETKVEERTGQLATANQEITLLNKRLKKENVRMGAELDVAKQLQQMVLPKEEEFLEIDSLDIAGFMEPAEEVGGDYYEVLNHDGHIKIGIGDVTGHGLESGVIMLMVQTTVRALLLAGIDDPETFLNIVNRTIYHNAQRMDTDKNLTMSLLDYQNGTLQLTGQHEEVLLVRKDGKIELIDTLELGFMVGVIDDIAKFISHQEFTLQPGDGVVLYTDGITEAQNMEEEQYSLERLCEVVSSNWLGNAKKVQQAVITDVKNYIGKQKVLDDITLLVLKQE